MNINLKFPLKKLPDNNQFTSNKKMNIGKKKPNGRKNPINAQRKKWTNLDRCSLNNIVEIQSKINQIYS